MVGTHWILKNAATYSATDVELEGGEVL